MSGGVPPSPNDDPDLSDEELLAARTAWFQAYTPKRSVIASAAGGPYTCPCCGYRTLRERGGYEICAECGWEDDGQDDHDSDIVWGGPNGPRSLDAARSAYVAEGGTPERHTAPRQPE